MKTIDPAQFAVRFPDAVMKTRITRVVQGAARITITIKLMESTNFDAALLVSCDMEVQNAIMANGIEDIKTALPLQDRLEKTAHDTAHGLISRMEKEFTGGLFK